MSVVENDETSNKEQVTIFGTSTAVLILIGLFCMLNIIFVVYYTAFNKQNISKIFLHAFIGTGVSLYVLQSAFPQYVYVDALSRTKSYWKYNVEQFQSSS